MPMCLRGPDRGEGTYKPNKHSKNPKNPKQLDKRNSCGSNLGLTRTQEDVDEYGSLEPAVQGRTVDAEKVCIETVCKEFKCSY